ncbi:MAG: hypothetical protein QOF09_2796 [Alphaproteobacteria bacterium]|jgi:hypothetical protein|nr:hypothetical protein [Alphaproteobacteria bacterium]
MRHDPKPLPLFTLTVFAAGLLLGGCSSFNVSLPSFGNSGSPDAAPPPPGVGGVSAMPSKYAPEEFVGRWGYTSYQNEADRARTIATARGLCRSPYVIAKGPSGGVLMHLADDKQPSELRLKGSPDGRNYIGPDGDAGLAQDQEIVSFDGRVLVTRYVDPDAGKRYGNMVRVRCTPKA